MYCELTFTVDLEGAKPELTWVRECYRNRHCRWRCGCTYPNPVCIQGDVWLWRNKAELRSGLLGSGRVRGISGGNVLAARPMSNLSSNKETTHWSGCPDW